MGVFDGLWQADRMGGQVADGERRGGGGKMSEETSSENTGVFDGPDDEIIRLVEAHARHVGAQLPRGQLGTQAAESFLVAISGAVRLRLGDITGTASSIVETFVAHGLLPVLPNPKVSRAIPRLLAPLTPLVEARSARVWSLWLTGLQDPRSPLVAKLRKATPAAALAVRSPAPTGRVRTLRELTGERDALAAQVPALRAELAGLAAQLDERTVERDMLASRVAALRAELAGLAVQLDERAHERDVLAAQVCALRAEIGSLTARLRERTAERDGAATRAAAVTDERAGLQERLRLAEETLARAQAEHQPLDAAGAAVPGELEHLAEFYEEKLREAEARASERQAWVPVELADLQAFLRESVRGQEQLTLFALRRGRR
jgi:hypothetical protein